MRVLHITSHLGGGVGSVIFAWMKNDKSNIKHRIVSLDRNKNKEWKSISCLYKNSVILDGFWYEKNWKRKIKKYVQTSDTIIVHWWNHPLIYDFICNCDLPPCRVIIWCHAACLKAPYTIPEFLIEYADKFILTSPVTYESDDIKFLSDEQKRKLDVIWSTSGIDDFKKIQKKNHDGIVVGYIGSANFGKLHRNFIKQCSLVRNKNIRFEVYSIDSQEELIREVKELGIENRFHFGGSVSRDCIPEILSGFDIFGYPLQPNHYGTCEQALGEAMAAGVVPVVINNPPELYIVKNNVNGIVIDSIDEYAKKIDELCDCIDQLDILCKNAKITAMKLYDIDSTLNKWESVFSEIISTPKKTRKILNNCNNAAEKLYIYSQGKQGTIFVNYLNAKSLEELTSYKIKIIELFKSNDMYLSKSKGSVSQYLNYFPGNKILQEWVKLVEECNA